MSKNNRTNIAGRNRSNIFEVRKSGKLIAYYGRQGRVYDVIKKVTTLTNVDIDRILSKKINPDGFIFNIAKKELTIFEKK